MVTGSGPCQDKLGDRKGTDENIFPGKPGESMTFDIWSIPDESDLSEVRDTLVKNGMFNPGRSGTEKEYQDFERDEIELHNKNFAECIEVY